MNLPRQDAGLSATELVVLVCVLAVLAAALLPLIAARREEARIVRCRNNLNQLVKGMATYWNEHAHSHSLPCPLGRGRNPGTYRGAEWLASLYWTGIVPDPGVFLCPSSGDANEDGVDIGAERAAPTFGSRTVSYAGVHYSSPFTGAMMELSFQDFPFHSSTTPMASDDTQGEVNHSGGMAVLFFDAHVEWRTSAELDPTRAVGQKGVLLEPLAN